VAGLSEEGTLLGAIKTSFRTFNGAKNCIFETDLNVA
jgi:hypothetical protein